MICVYIIIIMSNKENGLDRRENPRKTKENKTKVGNYNAATCTDS